MQLASRIRHGAHARPSSIPDGGIDFTPGRGSVTSVPSVPSMPSVPSVNLGAGSSTSSTVDFSQWPNLQVEREQLQKKGYADEAVGYLLHLLSGGSEEEHKKNMTLWLSRKGEVRAKKEAGYIAEWRKMEAAKAAKQTSEKSASGDDGDAETKLRGNGYDDPDALKYMMKRLQDDPGKADAQLQTWLSTESSTTVKNEAEYKRKWLKANPVGKGAADAGGAKWTGPAKKAKVMMDLAKMKEELAPMFPDPWVRDGMLEYYRSFGDLNAANKAYEDWKTNTAKRAEYTKAFQILGERVKRWRLQLYGTWSRGGPSDSDPGATAPERLPLPVDEAMEALHQRIIKQGVFTGVNQRYGMLWKLWRLNAEEQEQLMAKWENEEALNTVKKSQEGPVYRHRDLWGVEQHSRPHIDGRAHAYNVIFQQVKCLYGFNSARDPLMHEGETRCGTAVSKRKIKALQRHPRWKYINISDQCNILRLLSGPRSMGQEEAVLALLKTKRITFEIEKRYHGSIKDVPRECTS